MEFIKIKIKVSRWRVNDSRFVMTSLPYTALPQQETTKKLIAEELATDDSFVIFQHKFHTTQELINETLRKRKI